MLKTSFKWRTKNNKIGPWIDGNLKYPSYLAAYAGKQASQDGTYSAFHGSGRYMLVLISSSGGSLLCRGS